MSALEAQLAASEQARRETVKGIERAATILFDGRHSMDIHRAISEARDILDELIIANAAENLDAVVRSLTEGK